MASRTGPPDVRDLGAQLMDPEVQSDVARTRKVITKVRNSIILVVGDN